MESGSLFFLYCGMGCGLSVFGAFDGVLFAEGDIFRYFCNLKRFYKNRI